MKLSEKFRSLLEGAVERSETEGVKQVTSNYKKIPQSFFVLKKMTAPFTREPMSDSREGCPYDMI